MPSPSKEEKVLKLILEGSPLKEWHFNEIVRETKVTKAVANKWLKKYIKEGLLKHIKERGRFPYFTVGNNNPVYYSKKKIYAMEKLHQSGLLAELLSQKTKTIIVFGSFIKGDWYKESDIDVFFMGEVPQFDKHFYERKLRRSIELHFFEDKKEIEEVKTGLIKNIVNGYCIKGQIQD